MVIPVNNLSIGSRLRVGKNKYEVLDVQNQIGLTKVVYKTDAGKVKSKAYESTDKVKIFE